MQQRFYALAIALCFFCPQQLMSVKYKELGLLSQAIIGCNLNQINFDYHLNKPEPRETRNNGGIIHTITYPDTRATEQDIVTANILCREFNKGTSLIHYLTLKNNKKALLTLLEYLPEGLLEKDNKGNTPLFYAIKNKNASLVRFFILGQRYFTKASLTHRNLKGDTILHCAINKKSDNIVDILLNNGYFLESKEKPLFYLNYAKKMYKKSPCTELQKIIVLLEEETNLVGLTKKHFKGNRREYSDSFEEKLSKYLNRISLHNKAKELEIILKAEKIFSIYREQTFGDLLATYFEKLGEEKCQKYLNFMMCLNEENIKNEGLQKFIFCYIASQKLEQLGYSKHK